MRDFNRTLNEYRKFNKRQPAEIVNAKLYFVSLNALNATLKTPKPQIATELNATSRTNPKRTLGELIVFKQLHKNKKMPKKTKTLVNNMAKWVEKLIKGRQNRVGFLAAGWIPAIKKLDFWNRRGDLSFTKKFAPKKDSSVKQYGSDKGDVQPAKENRESVIGTIFNFIGQGKQASTTVTKKLQEGLSKAIRREMASMRQYIQQKMEAQHRKMRQKGQIL